MYYMFLAPGFEETEAIAPLDIIRRADIEIYTVGIGGKTVIGAHNIPVIADVMDSEICPSDDIEGIILPGGMPGTLNLEKSAFVGKFIDYCVEKNLLIGAICAAPSILGHKNLLIGKKAVCFPGFEEQLLGATVLKDAVCTDGNIITACGAGAAMKFGFEIVKYISGKAVADHYKDTMLCDR
jgi:4-methyl-5(b-hydroxyethyl)-thiazole monophosphate biosynthesis